ncbi:MAG: hypothetical protein Q9170_004669 [Blastenia crenularia]
MSTRAAQKMREWEAKNNVRLARMAHDNGYATYEEYRSVRDKWRDDVWRKYTERANERVRNNNEQCEPSPEESQEDSEAEDWFRSERCNCQAHFLGVFCPGNLKETPGSMEGDLGEFHRAHQPNVAAMDLDERLPSKRHCDQNLYRLWSVDSQEAQYQEPLPICFKQDRVIQEILSKAPRNQTTFDDEANSYLPSPKSHPQPIQSLINNLAESVIASNEKGKRGGKGTIKGRASKSASTRLSPHATTGNPSIKKKAKGREGNVTPPWLRTFLEQPRETRSQDSKILFELDAQSQVVATQPRRSQRTGQRKARSM